MQQTRQIGASSDSHRETIIKEFAYVVKAMAYRLAYRLPAYMDAEDLVSVGIMGLMDAMDKYDPGREAKFKTYAEFRIRGAMLDEIRSMDWIPRSVHERVTLLQRVHTKLLNRLGRPPTDEEVAAEMNLSPAELDDFLVRSREPSWSAWTTSTCMSWTGRKFSTCLPTRIIRIPWPSSSTIRSVSGWPMRFRHCRRKNGSY